MKMFQEKFIRLCDIKRVHPTVACTSVGLSSSAFSEWTENTVPRQATLARIADYFGVTEDYLRSDEIDPSAFIVVSKDGLSKIERLMDLMMEMTEEELEDLEKYAVSLISRNRT
jgi:transcriptional regulator with XRE-family HTH domain